MTATATRATRPRRPPPSPLLTVGVLVAVAITVLAGLSIGFDLTPLFTDLTRGGFIVAEFLKPNWAFFDNVWEEWIQTLSIAIVATAIGTVVALLAAMLASPVSSPNRVVVRIARSVLSVVRSLPDIGWVYLFVAVVGVNTIAGVLALAVFNVGIIAKLTSESIDAIDPGPIEAADAAGARLIQRDHRVVFPAVLPNYLSFTLYVFEINVRASVIVGLVGGGGLGQRIQFELSRFAYGNLSMIIIEIFVVVFLIDLLSQYLRRRLV